MINGISVSGLSEYASEVQGDRAEGDISYGVSLSWRTGTRARVETRAMKLGRHRIARPFSWTIDEPRQLLGHNHGPNPQEYLLAAVGGCLLVAYAVGASTMGIQLETLDLEVDADLDIAGFLGTCAAATVALSEIRYRVTIGGDASEQEFARLHEIVQERSPNRMTVAQGVPVVGEMTVIRRDQELTQ